MSPRSDPVSSRSGTSISSTTRTRYTTSHTASRAPSRTTTAVVGTIKFWRRLRQYAAIVRRTLSETVSAAGWLLIVTAVGATTVGLTYGWIELTVAGFVAAALLLLCLPFLFGSRAYDIDLSLEHAHTVVGNDVTGSLRVTNVGRRIALPGSVDVPIGPGLVEINVPFLRPGGTHDEQITIPTAHRGVFSIGPARTVRADPLGILRRETTGDDRHTLYVHPTTTAIARTSTGFVKDLEGNPSTTVVDADISFHALREYAPGDSQRQIHWKSTAKTGTLMVRQFEETRRSRMLIALAVSDDEFADDEEFELAVSAAGSLGLQGIRDGRDVTIVHGGEHPEFARNTVHSIRELSSLSTRTLLDDLAGVHRRDAVSPLRDAARLGVETHRDVSAGFLICGSTVTAKTIHTAAFAFPSHIGVAAIICHPEAEPRVRRLGTSTVMTIGLLDDLRHLSRQGARP